MKKNNLLHSSAKNLEFQDITFAVANASNDGIIIINPEHKISFVNKVLKRWLNWSDINTDKWIEKSDKFAYKEFLEIAEQQTILESLFESVEGKQNLIAESIDIKLKNPIYKYINIYTAPIYHKTEGYKGRVWIIDDQTKEKKIEKAKTEFISIASHQLRTPLTAIRGYLSMITDDPKILKNLDEDTKEFIEAANEGAIRLANIVEDLLNISRLEMGTTAVEPKKFNLKEELSRTIKDYKILAEEKNIKLKTVYSFDKNTKFKTDYNLMQHIISNLTDNAVKYTPPKGEVVLKFEVKNNQLNIVIKDSGIGIPKKQQERIFEKFFRADNVRNEDFRGTGIGLYYVKSLIDSLNGNITFKSEEDKGTTFYIDIPNKT